MNQDQRIPTVSVILTSYNHAKYLRESIDSVLAQTFTDFELVIVDDCSTDESWAIIDSYQDERVVKVRHPENRLFYANPTIQCLTRGKYIAIQHSDDIWEPDKLRRQVAFLDMHPDCGASFTWVQVVDEAGRPFSDSTDFYYDIFDQPNRTRHEWLNFFFYKGNALCHPSVLIRRQCYEECGYYRYGLVQLPDFDMWIRLCMKYEIYVMPERLVRFRLRNNGKNSSGNRRDTRIRTVTEFFQVWEDYLAIASFFELTLIFPDAGRFERAEQSNVKFAFAMICLADDTFQWSKALGISLLFELMRQEDTREQLLTAYGFSHLDFLRITGETEFFLAETVEDKKRQIDGLEREIAGKEQQILHLHQVVADKEAQIAHWNGQWKDGVVERQALRAELESIYSSKKWRYAMKVSKFVRLFRRS